MDYQYGWRSRYNSDIRRTFPLSGSIQMRQHSFGGQGLPLPSAVIHHSYQRTPSTLRRYSITTNAVNNNYYTGKKISLDSKWSSDYLLSRLKQPDYTTEFALERIRNRRLHKLNTETNLSILNKSLSIKSETHIDSNIFNATKLIVFNTNKRNNEDLLLNESDHNCFTPLECRSNKWKEPETIADNNLKSQFNQESTNNEYAHNSDQLPETKCLQKQMRQPLHIPTETLWEIVEFLSFDDCAKVSSVSRTFAQLAEPRMKLRVQLLLQQIERTKKQLNETNSQIAERQQQISTLNQQIYNMNDRLGNMNNRLLSMNSQIIESHKRIDELLQRLRAIRFPQRENKNSIKNGNDNKSGSGSETEATSSDSDFESESSEDN